MYHSGSTPQLLAEAGAPGRPHPISPISISSFSLYLSSFSPPQPPPGAPGAAGAKTFSPLVNAIYPHLAETGAKIMLAEAGAPAQTATSLFLLSEISISFSLPAPLPAPTWRAWRSWRENVFPSSKCDFPPSGGNWRGCGAGASIFGGVRPGWGHLVPFPEHSNFKSSKSMKKVDRTGE